jgi:ComF family protein
MREALASLVFPAPCRICAQMLDTGSRIPFCHACIAVLAQTLAEPLCSQCGRPIVSTAVADSQSSPLCHLCRLHTYDFDAARSFGPYTLPMSRAILMLKYGEVTPLGAWFARHLARLVNADKQIFAADVLVPVPLDPARLRERGYNQAELIARPLARILGIPFRSYLLVRTKPRPDKIRLTRRERWETVRGAYAAHKSAQVDKLRVLLVDDVLTTGATLDACSKALRKAGAARVVGLTVARTLPQLAALDAISPYQDLGV